MEGVGVVINNLASSNNGSDCPASTGLPRSCLTSTVFIHHTNLRLLRAKNSFNRIPIGTVFIDNCPSHLLLSVPRDNGLVARETGCPLSLNSIIINSATLSHSPRGLSM